MQSIHPDHLETVRGGFGALLGALLQAAPGIMQGVSGIIGAAKAGKGGGGDPSAAQAAPPQAGPPQGAAAMAAAASVGVPQQPDPRVSVTVGHF